MGASTESGMSSTVELGGEGDKFHLVFIYVLGSSAHQLPKTILGKHMLGRHGDLFIFGCNTYTVHDIWTLN